MFCDKLLVCNLILFTFGELCLSALRDEILSCVLKLILTCKVLTNIFLTDERDLIIEAILRRTL